MNHNSVVASAHAITGRRYQLQKTRTLVDPHWNNVGQPVTAKSNMVNISDTNASDTAAFYKIVPLD